MSRLLHITALLVILFIFHNEKVAGQDIGGISLSAGRIHTGGFYSDYFNDSWSFGLGVIFEMQGIYNNFFTEANILFDQRSMKESPDSYLRMYAIEAGAGLFLTLWHHTAIYIGIGFQESYIQFHADVLGREESCFKPGAMLKAGVFIPLNQYASLRVGIMHSVSEISEKYLHSTSLIVSGVFRYPPAIWSIGIPQKEGHDVLQKENPDSLYKKALESAASGEIEKAALSFKRVLDINPGHNDAGEMLKKIDFAKENYRKASALIKKQKYFDAIAPLEKSIPYVKSASAELNLTRAKLLGEIPVLERNGIEAYEKKEYDRCIAIMNRIKTIDPVNVTAAMYLPRAIRRKEAIERLK